MNRQTGAARISIAPTKAKGASVWRSLLECVSLAAGFVLLRLTADGLYGQLAFGLFVGALYCNRLLAPSVLFLATSFASGIDCVLVSAFHPRSRSKMLRCRQRKGLHPDNFLFTNPARIVTIKSNPSAVRCVLLPGSVRPAALHPQTFSRLWHSAGPRRYVFCRRFFL